MIALPRHCSAFAVVKEAVPAGRDAAGAGGVHAGLRGPGHLQGQPRHPPSHGADADARHPNRGRGHDPSRPPHGRRTPGALRRNPLPPLSFQEYTSKDFSPRLPMSPSPHFLTSRDIMAVGPAIPPAATTLLKWSSWDPTCPHTSPLDLAHGFIQHVLLGQLPKSGELIEPLLPLFLTYADSAQPTQPTSREE